MDGDLLFKFFQIHFFGPKHFRWSQSEARYILQQDLAPSRPRASLLQLPRIFCRCPVPCLALTPDGHPLQTQYLFPRLLSAASRKRSLLFKFLLGRTAPIFHFMENRKNLQLEFQPVRRKRSLLFKFLLGRTAPIFHIVENRKNLQLWFLHYPVASRACSIFIQFNSDSMVSSGSPVYFATRFGSIPSASIAFAFSILASYRPRSIPCSNP